MATHKHRAAFTLALRTISPSLSALHASRLRLTPNDERGRARGPDRPQPPSLTPLTCVQCGHASVRVRVVRRGVGAGKAKATGKQITPKITHGNNNQEKAQTATKVTDEHASRNEPPHRVLERTCTTCTFVEHIPVPRGAAALFRSTSSCSVRKARRVARLRVGDTETVGLVSRVGDDSSGCATSFGLSDAPGMTPPPAPPHARTHSHAGSHTLSHHTTSAHTPPISGGPAPKKRPKKKPGLQELLERTRQREDAVARAKVQSGLSSFLDAL